MIWSQFDTSVFLDQSNMTSWTSPRLGAHGALGVDGRGLVFAIQTGLCPPTGGRRAREKFFGVSDLERSVDGVDALSFHLHRQEGQIEGKKWKQSERMKEKNERGNERERNRERVEGEILSQKYLGKTFFFFPIFCFA
jgi:hypothetical protein